MSADQDQQANQQKWDQRFAQQNMLPQVASVLLDNNDLLPKQGRGLEIACGLGANSLYLAEQGIAMEAWDISSVALDKLARRAQQQGLAVQTRQADVEARPVFMQNHYDLIVVSHFLYRPLCAQLSAALRHGGLLFYQTFCLDQQANAGSAPRNPHYKLKTDELLALFADLDVLRYSEGSNDPERSARKAFYVGRKPE